jgi:hypothetical protein
VEKEIFALVNFVLFVLRISIKPFSLETWKSNFVINIYEPYENKVYHWENILSKYFLKYDMLILGCDLNCTLKRVDI